MLNTRTEFREHLSLGIAEEFVKKEDDIHKRWDELYLAAMYKFQKQEEKSCPCCGHPQPRKPIKVYYEGIYWFSYDEPDGEL
jgi:hypothetical protein